MPVSALWEVCLELYRLSKNDALRINAHRISEIETTLWLALHNLKLGDGSRESLEYLADGLNYAMVYAEMGYQADHIEVVWNAQNGAIRAWERGQRTGRWTLDGDGIRAITTSLELHGEQLRAITEGDSKRAAEIVRARLAAGHTLDAQTPHS